MLILHTESYLQHARMIVLLYMLSTEYMEIFVFPGVIKSFDKGWDRKRKWTEFFLTTEGRHTMNCTYKKNPQWKSNAKMMNSTQ